MRALRAVAVGAWLVAALLAPAGAHARLGVEFHTGAPYHFATPLRIRQEGHADLRFTARYRADAMRMPIYWALRVSRHAEGGAWSLELMHDKVYVDNPPADVQVFSVSHGLNFVTVQRAWARGPDDLRAGAGLIVAHPENTVRGRALDERRGLFRAGYHLAGPAVLVAAGRRAELRPWLTLGAEARASVAPVQVPVEGGHARFTNLGVHVLVGMGVRQAGRPEGVVR
jgi:hypothetical protein